MPEHPRTDLIALGVQQPWAELILRGIKTLEVRAVHTRQRGTVYLYASKRTSSLPAAERAARQFGIEVQELPSGLLVGTVEIRHSRPCTRRDASAGCVPVSLLKNRIGWQLARPERLAKPLAVRFLPYGVWFYPFGRKSRQGRRQRRSAS